MFIMWISRFVLCILLRVDLNDLISWCGSFWINFMVLVSRKGRFLIIIFCMVVLSVVNSLFFVNMFDLDRRFISVFLFMLVYLIRVMWMSCLWLLCCIVICLFIFFSFFFNREICVWMICWLVFICDFFGLCSLIFFFCCLRWVYNCFRCGSMYWCWVSFICVLVWEVCVWLVKMLRMRMLWFSILYFSFFLMFCNCVGVSLLLKMISLIFLDLM